MTYTKAVLTVQLFDVEDVITTSGASLPFGYDTIPGFGTGDGVERPGGEVDPPYDGPPVPFDEENDV